MRQVSQRKFQGLISRPFEEDKMMDPIFTFFSENIEIVTKEQLLEALKNALRSADCWRDACLLGYSSVQGRSEEGVAP